MTATTGSSGDWLTVREIATLLGCSPTTIYSHIRAGDLPAIKIGLSRQGLRVARADFDAFLAASTTS